VAFTATAIVSETRFVPDSEGEWELVGLDLNSYRSQAGKIAMGIEPCTSWDDYGWGFVTDLEGGKWELVGYDLNSYHHLVTGEVARSRRRLAPND